MTCPHCGSENPSGSLFCGSCGRELVPSAEREAPPPASTPTERVGPLFAASAPRAPLASGGWGPALRWGVLAFVVVLVVGQLTAFLVRFASNDELSTADAVKLGGLYVSAFHHTGIVIELESAGGIDLADELPIGPGLGVEGKLGLALMLITGLAVFLVARGGRAAARSAGGTALARGVHGLKVAPAYALLCGVLGLLVKFDFDFPDNPLFGGVVSIHPSYLGAFLWPLAIAAAAGFAGGLLSARDDPAARGEPWSPRVVGALAGGWRMFVWALVLAFVGFLVLAAVEADVTRAYFEGISEGGARGATVILVHHVMLLPNQSMWMLVPAMGGCDGFSFSAQGATGSFNFLCYHRFPAGAPTDAVDPFLGTSGIGNFETAPVGYFLFLLVPLVATVVGGRVAARRSGAENRAEGGVAGALAGVVYGVLVLVGIVLSRFTVSAEGSFAGLGAQGGSGSVGPDLVVGTVLGVVWGLAGGALGGLMATRRLAARPAQPPPATAATDPPHPSA